VDAWGVELELGIENKKLTDLIIPPRLRRLWFLAGVGSIWLSGIAML
jgi:hypothetical protein